MIPKSETHNPLAVLWEPTDRVYQVSWYKSLDELGGTFSHLSSPRILLCCGGGRWKSSGHLGFQSQGPAYPSSISKEDATVVLTTVSWLSKDYNTVIITEGNGLHGPNLDCP